VAPAPGAIAEGMAQIIAHCARMGAAARQRALERFDLSHWLARHERVFRALLGKTA